MTTARELRLIADKLSDYPGKRPEGIPRQVDELSPLEDTAWCGETNGGPRRQYNQYLPLGPFVVPWKPTVYLTVAWVGKGHRYYFERHWTDPSGRSGRYGMLEYLEVTREEALELVANVVPARMAKLIAAWKEWESFLRDLEANYFSMTPEQRARMRALSESIGHEGGAYSPANREVETKAKRKRRANEVGKAFSEAAAQRARLL